MGPKENRRVLIIDDNESIHADFRKIIGIETDRDTTLDTAAAALFGDSSQAAPKYSGFEIDSAFQGQEGLALVQKSRALGRPYALAFVDVRMPPGWDGIETIRQIWQVDRDIQIVLCTAYSDYSWSEMSRVLGDNDCWLILKKPFDNIEVRQITSALVAKWNLAQKANQAMHNLLEMVRERTAELDASIQLLREEVTERRRSEHALREAETRTRVILDTAPDAILTIDQSGVIESSNGAAEGIFGCAPSQLVGKNITVLLPSFEVPQNQKLDVKPGVATPTVNHQPVRGLRHDGSAFPADVGWSEVRFKNRTQYTVIVRDMTEQTLLEAQLIQTQKIESIGQLASGIAHEINTPTQFVGQNIQFLKDAFEGLAGLLGKFDDLLDAAKRDEVDDHMLEQIQSAIKAVDMPYLRKEIPKAIDQSLDGVGRVASIVGAIGEYSHPGDGVKVELNVNRLIETTAMVARNEWTPVADLNFDLEPQLPQVRGVATELSQVILNLIVNAAHAIGEAQKDGSQQRGQITIRTRRQESAIEIQVCDTGIGIKPEDYGKIFDPFYTTKKVGKGTGQGLAITRTIVVNRHQGELTFESALGKGTTFTIRLPLLQHAVA